MAIENPQDIIAISARPYGQRAVLKFANYTGAKSTVGRHTPGALSRVAAWVGAFVCVQQEVQKLGVVHSCRWAAAWTCWRMLLYVTTATGQHGGSQQ